ncbi:hypothetical protein BU17DRAFT_93578 [Hysterangium stoloniferum]|nr:hypothetical protein BU17DRAFT_93578 [Hysterangium stoloniferum]
MPARVTLPLRIARLLQASNPRGRDIVLNILKATYPQPVRTQQIYKRVRKDFPDGKVEMIIPPSPPPIVVRRLQQSRSNANEKIGPPQPPFPDHPIRSQKYLKDIILEDLARRRLIKKVHTMRDPTPEELAVKKSKGKGKKSKAANAAVTLNVLGKVDEWGWVMTSTKEEAAEMKERARIQQAIAGQGRLDHKKVAKERKVRFNLEWGHLNVRRQRARVEKLERENKKASIVENMREEGRREEEEKTTS